MKNRYLLNGQDCNPIKRENIYLEINHDQQAIINQPKPHVGINNLYFGREDILKILNALNTNPGITEGVPFDIEITEGGKTEVINMYLNLMDGFKSSKNGIECSVKMLQSLDWLDDRANSFTLESMYNETGVPAFQIDGITYISYQDYFDKRVIFIPYVISAVPNYHEAFTVIFSLIYIGNELYKTIKNIGQWAAPEAGAGLVIGIIQLIAEIAYAVLLIALLIDMIIQLINCLIQAVKYHGAMLVIDMLKIISYKMGLTFQSSIWDNYPWNQIAYLPEKFNPIEEINPQGYNVFGIPLNGFAQRGFKTPGYATLAAHDSMTTTIQKGYYNGLGGDFLRLIKTFCNGKIIIPDQTNTLIMERRDFYPSNTPFQLQDIRQDWNGYNTDEMAATIIIKFASDLNDKNCIDKYIGTILQATTQQIITNNSLMVNLQGLREIQINAARGIRKDNLNFIEITVGGIDVVWHAIWDAFVIGLNVFIAGINVLIAVFNVIIFIWNLLMDLIGAIVTAISDIYNLINKLVGGTNNVNPVNTAALKINQINYVPFFSFKTLQSSIFTDRIGALLLENDMVNTPKLLFVDTQRSDFTDPGGYSGQKRIAFLHPANQNIINADNLWNDFYYIDNFTNDYPSNNRYTKISPANNHPDDNNPTSIRLSDFKNLVSNPKFKDNFGEEVIMESIQWHIEDNGKAIIDFRKAGWLSDPQNMDGTKRAQEININLTIKTSIPNGQ